MNASLFLVIVLCCAVPVLLLASMDKRPVFALMVAVLVFWAGLALVIEVVAGCYPWSCESHKDHKAGPE